MGKRLRKGIQVLNAIVTNGYIKGFLPKGPSIYSGPLKRFCVPGMNCYSCPGALGACPIGSLQAVLSAKDRKFPFYILGFLASVGLLVGRFICGWLCVFGLVQELLYKIPSPKLELPKKIDRTLRYLKYLVFAVFVIGLPFLVRDEYGIGDPFFCKYVCPVGTLEGGIPLVLLNDVLRPALGWLFRWKMLVLIFCVLTSVFIYRPFCKYICPLGAFYSLFQKLSIVRMKIDGDLCIDCGACSKVCGMKVDPRIDPNDPECIRCGECKDNCPVHALSFEIMEKEIGKIRKEST